jgi:hypothetical protein
MLCWWWHCLRYLCCFQFIGQCWLTIASPLRREYDSIRLVHTRDFADFSNKYLHAASSAETRNDIDRELVLRENLFLGVASLDCRALLGSPAFEAAGRYAQSLHAVTLIGEQHHYFSYNNHNNFDNRNNHINSDYDDHQRFPVVLRDCAEVFFFRAGDRIDRPRGRTTRLGDDAELTQWAKVQTRLSPLTMTNGFRDVSLQVFWHEEALPLPVPQGRLLLPGESLSITAFLGHVFSANAIKNDDAADNNIINNKKHFDGEAYHDIVDYFAANTEHYVFSPANRLARCDVQESETQRFVQQAVSCDDLRLRFVQFSHSEWHIKRMALNYAQPKLVAGYSERGFEHRSLPDSTFRFLRKWYFAAQQLQNNLQEIESVAGPCMNQHVSPTVVTHLDELAKIRLQRDLQPLLEQWYGKGPLQLTSIYGIR